MTKMVHTFSLLCFSFLGGNTYTAKKSIRQSPVFNEIVKLLAPYYPGIFPSGCRPDKDSVNTVTVDLPLHDDGSIGMRVRTVYYRISRQRSYWNAFSFAYRLSDLGATGLQAVEGATAEEWHAAVDALDEGSDKLTLTVKTPVTQAFEGGSSDCYIHAFPMPNGTTFSGIVKEALWKKELQLPRPKKQTEEKPPLVEDPATETSGTVEKLIKAAGGKFGVGLSLGLSLGVSACAGVIMLLDYLKKNDESLVIEPNTTIQQPVTRNQQHIEELQQKDKRISHLEAENSDLQEQLQDALQQLEEHEHSNQEEH